MWRAPSLCVFPYVSGFIPFYFFLQLSFTAAAEVRDVQTCHGGAPCIFATALENGIVQVESPPPSLNPPPTPPTLTHPTLTPPTLTSPTLNPPDPTPRA